VILLYEIVFSQKAKKQLFKLERLIQERIISALERIKIRPESYIVKLVGDPGYKLRVGDYRVIMDIVKSKLLVLVIKIGHRKNIYEKSG
jgi:mRNA interferase RelE/StbE